MFGKLKDAFGGLKDALSRRELKADEVDAVLEQFKLVLVEDEVAFDAAEQLLVSLREGLVGSKVERGRSGEDVVQDALRDALLSLLKPLEVGPLVDAVRSSASTPRSKSAHKSRGPYPYTVVFLGINGGGKTTTIAKVAYSLKAAGLKPLIAAADTFRAGAIEQVTLHAQRIGVEVISQGYGADPAAVARDAVEHARSKSYDVVLVDTAGRMYTRKKLMDELKKIVEVSEADENVMIVDALTGNDAIAQAREFNEGVGVDSSIVTKLDADVKGGVVLSLAHELRKPIRYLGVGQGYGDLVPFRAEQVVDSLLSRA